MKTAVRQTSIDALHQTPIDRQQQQLLRALNSEGESCIADLSRRLGWYPNVTAARLHELKPATLENPNGLGKVEFIGKRPSNATGITAEFWRVNRISKSLFEK